MLRGFVLIVIVQFLGEALARFLAIPVPGPVIGLALMVCAGILSPTLMREAEAAADPLLRNLSLLFVPAGVGVLQYLGLIRAEIVPLLAVLVLSTAVTLVVTALVFAALARGTGGGEGER